VIRRARDDAGFATLETTLMVAVLVPLLFGVVEFGWLFQRWLAAESVAMHAARYAGELGGDEPALRAFVSRELSAVNIDPARARVEVVPSRVDWREPVRVTVRTTERVDLPFLFATRVDIAASAVARGELDR
jgi:Flp pilus assembly protein TadG